MIQKTNPRPGVEKITGSGCTLTVRSDQQGVFAYMLKTTFPPLLSPTVTIYYPTDGVGGDVHVLFSYRHILAEWQESEQVVAATKSIKMFLEECEDAGVFRIVGNEKKT